MFYGTYVLELVMGEVQHTIWRLKIMIYQGLGVHPNKKNVKSVYLCIPNHLSLPSMEDGMRSRKDVRENSYGL